MNATFIIKDTFNIMGQGIVAVGDVTNGIIKNGMTLELEDQKMTVKSIERFRKILNEAETGDNVGLLLADSNPDVLKKYIGQTLTFLGNEEGVAPVPPAPIPPTPIEPKGFLDSLFSLFKK